MRLFQYGFGALVAAISFVSLFSWTLLPRREVFIIATALWIFFLILLYRFFKKKLEWKEQLLAISILTPLTGSALVSIIEHAQLRGLAIGFICIMLGLLYGGGIAGDALWWSTGKPYRRFVMMNWVFNVYGGVTFLFALTTFFHSPTIFFLATIGSSLLSGFIAFMIWRLYFDPLLPPTIIWAIVVALIMVEIAWVLHFLPLGYTVLGFLVTWIWYLMQLFVRFHLNRGVEWRRQMTFLIANGVLFALLLITFVRWV